MKMKNFVYGLIFSLICISCDSHKETNNNRGADQDSIAIALSDSGNADLWAYLYSHRFVSEEGNVMTFIKDRAYINDNRIADALTVVENENVTASIEGYSIPDYKRIRLAVIRDEVNRCVVDMTIMEHFIFYLEGE